MTSRAQRLLSEAKGFIESGEEAQWSAAERMWQANKEEGCEQRDIAEEVGLSWRTVQTHIRVWGTYSDTVPRLRFTDAYYAVQGSTPADREDKAANAVARQRPEKIVDAIKKAPPEQRREIIEGIYRSTELEADVGHAATKITRETRDQNDQRDKTRAPAAYEMRNQLDAQAEIARMDHAGLKALKSLQEVDDDTIEELDRELFLWRLRRIAATCDWMIERLTTGARSVDDELADLLSREA